jgi:tetratricopeptide (TPR) repeat protein
MPAPTRSLLSTALAHHQRGELSQAVSLYHQVVSAEPNHEEALQLLGVAYLQLGQPRQAVDWMERARALQPNASALHANLGEAYRLLGQLDPAVESFQKALQLKPDNADAAYNFALLFMQQGRAAEAAALFRQAIQHRPNFALAYNNLGNACRMLGDLEQARIHFQRAVELNPQLGLAHGNLGQLLLETNRPHDALKHCQEAVRLDPQLAPAHNNLGNVLRKLARPNDAKACYHEALRLAPNLAVTHHNLGEILLEQGQFDEAKRWFTQAVQLQPRNALFLVSLAKLAFMRHELAEAEAHLCTARQLDPNFAEARFLLANVFFEQGRFADAQTEYRALLVQQPNNPAIHCRLAEMLLEMNQREEALASLRTALRIYPQCVPALAQLAAQLGERMPAEEQAALRRLLDDPNVLEGDRAALLFALGQICDARGDYDEAAQHLTRANQIENATWQRSGRGYSAPAHTAFVDRLLSTFALAFFQRARGFGLDSERPVFIVGLPRSGTTLLEQVLASHSKVFGAGELRFAREDFEALGGGSDGTHEARAFDLLQSIDADVVRQMARRHLDRLDALNSTAERIIDKMPDNYLYIGFMALLFPRARFLHCCRDPRDVAVSCWITHFREIPWSNDAEQMASRFEQYRRVMEHWHTVLPVSVLDVHYEDMVADLPGVVRRALTFLDLEFEPACLEFYRNQRPVRTASLSQVRQPIYRRSVGRWRHYQKALQPLFDRLEDLFLPQLVERRNGVPKASRGRELPGACEARSS